MVHGGADNGVSTMSIFLPKSKRGIVVFTNGDNGESIYRNVIWESLDIGKAIFDCMYKISNIPEIVNLPEEILEKYVGEYLDQYGRDLNVAIAKKAGAIKVAGEGIGTFILYPEAEGEFFQEYSHIKYEFTKDDTGNIVKLKKTIEGRVINEAKKRK